VRFWDFVWDFCELIRLFVVVLRFFFGFFVDFLRIFEGLYEVLKKSDSDECDTTLDDC
jgi:hypothetical protein